MYPSVVTLNPLCVIGNLELTPQYSYDAGKGIQGALLQVQEKITPINLKVIDICLTLMYLFNMLIQK